MVHKKKQLRIIICNWLPNLGFVFREKMFVRYFRSVFEVNNLDLKMLGSIIVCNGTKGILCLMPKVIILHYRKSFFGSKKGHRNKAHIKKLYSCCSICCEKVFLTFVFPFPCMYIYFYFYKEWSSISHYDIYLLRVAWNWFRNLCFL